MSVKLKLPINFYTTSFNYQLEISKLLTFCNYFWYGMKQQL